MDFGGIANLIGAGLNLFGGDSGSEGGGFLEGIGSLLGSLFGGSSDKSTQAGGITDLLFSGGDDSGQGITWDVPQKDEGEGFDYGRLFKLGLGGLAGTMILKTLLDDDSDSGTTAADLLASQENAYPDIKPWNISRAPY